MRENDAVLALAKLLLAAGGHSKIRDSNGRRPSELGAGAGRATPRGELVKLLKNHERLVIDTAC